VPGRGFKRASKNAQAAGKKIRGRQMSTFAALELAYEERLYQKDGHSLSCAVGRLPVDFLFCGGDPPWLC